MCVPRGCCGLGIKNWSCYFGWNWSLGAISQKPWEIYLPVLHHSLTPLTMITSLAVNLPFLMNWWESSAELLRKGLQPGISQTNRTKVLTLRKPMAKRKVCLREGRWSKIKLNKLAWDVPEGLGKQDETQKQASKRIRSSSNKMEDERTELQCEIIKMLPRLADPVTECQYIKMMEWKIIVNWSWEGV